MSDWMENGCAECRTGVLSGMYSPEAAARQGRSIAPPTFIYRSIAAHTDLYRCCNCGAWWEFNAREAHVIAEDEAKKKFSKHFDALKQA